MSVDSPKRDHRMKPHRTSFPKIVLLYGLLLGVVLVAFKLFEYSYFSRRITLDLYLGITAVAFLAVGIIVGLKGGRGRPVKEEEEPAAEKGLEPSPTFTLQGTTIETGLSEREREILGHIAEGRTNPEIAEKLFLSPNTIKTHVSNIYRKLEVERRAQAVARAKELKILD